MLKRAVWIGLLGAFLIYLSSYIVLRNRGLREMPLLGVEGLLYDSVERVERTHDLSLHHFRARMYAPLNTIDQWVFGCPGPILGIMFELS